MNPASSNSTCGTIILVDAEEPGLILPLVTLTTESGEVWWWDIWIIWRWPSFDLHALVAWHSGWAIKSNWRSGLASSDVLSRSSGLYSDSVPRWEVHSCTWHVTLTSDISCTLADTLFMLNFVMLPGFKDIFTSDGFVNPGKLDGPVYVREPNSTVVCKAFSVSVNTRSGSDQCSLTV